jgi:hypothetical protein
MRKFLISALSTTLVAVGLVAQQNPKPWSQWSAKDAEKILNDSPWVQVQVETNTSEMTYSPTSGSSGTTSIIRPSGTTMRDEQAARNANRSLEGAYNQAVDIKYQVRFLSAKPIREGFASMILLDQPTVTAEDQKKAEKLKSVMQEFIDRNYGDYIVVAVTYEASDGRLAGKAYQELNAAAPATLKNKAYLERQDGKRVYLIDYRSPIQDGLGAKFVFPRTLNGRLFLTPDSGEVRFYAEVGTNVKLNRRFKVSDMIYRGKLEY